MQETYFGKLLLFTQREKNIPKNETKYLYSLEYGEDTRKHSRPRRDKEPAHYLAGGTSTSWGGRAHSAQSRRVLSKASVLAHGFGMTPFGISGRY